MERKDVILGRVLVERGWLSHDELLRCLKSAAAPAPHRQAPRSALEAMILERKLIPDFELEAVRGEITRVLGTDPGSGSADEEPVAEILAGGGQLTRERLREARASLEARKSELDSPGLIEYLLEQGWISFASLLEARKTLQRPDVPMTCRACRTPSVVLHYDPDRIYLCKACTGELVSTVSLPPAPVAVPARPPAPSGNPLGRYESPQEIGRGGAGVVYKAWDPLQKRWVALKVVKDTGRLEDLARFRREVEVARILHHPNIVATFEVAHVGSNHLIAMEFVEGETLTGKRMAPAKAALTIGILAHAVQYAHSRAIVHRDIKPQNIMIDRTGKPYLMDFGLAKTLDQPSTITSVGIAMGTPSFMAPEMAIGRTSRVDRRTDVYSLGAVLYDLLTGRPPFRGANPLDTLTKVVQEELLPPSQIVPGIPRELEQVVLKCLEKDKNLRYPTANHLANALERFASSPVS